MIEFFLRRPLFAGVLSFVVLLGGPDHDSDAAHLAVSADFAARPSPSRRSIRAPSAEMVMRSVTTPLEININGADGLQYMQSYSSANGTSVDHLHVRAGHRPDDRPDQRTARRRPHAGAASHAPCRTRASASKRARATSRSRSRCSPTSSSVSDVAVSNYADLNVIENLKRIPGVGQVEVLGDRTYGMRIWVDPHKLQANGVSLDTVTQRHQAEQRRRGAGRDRPAADHRLAAVSDSDLRSTAACRRPKSSSRSSLQAQPNGGYLRLGDVAQVELGAQNYITSARYNRQTSVVLAIEGEADGELAADLQERPGDDGARSRRPCPPVYGYKIAFDTSDFVRASIKEVVVTLLIAILLVVLVIFIFLQNWHSTLIPAITIPVSLIGTFAAMKLLGFSINTLTLFGLTLATGLVVDDAIVVLENIVRHIVDDKTTPFEATARAMREIGGAVVATSLVLMSVFVPVAFLPGTTGLLFQQFALTMAASIGISLFTAMTLAPVLDLRAGARRGADQQPVSALVQRPIGGADVVVREPRSGSHPSSEGDDRGLPRRDRSALGRDVQDHAARLLAGRRPESAVRSGDAADTGVDGPDPSAAVEKLEADHAQDAAGRRRSRRASASASRTTARTRPRCSFSSSRSRSGTASRIGARASVRPLPAVPQDSRRERRCPQIRPRFQAWARPAAFRSKSQDINNLGLPTLNKVGNAILAAAKSGPVAHGRCAFRRSSPGPYLVTKFDRVESARVRRDALSPSSIRSMATTGLHVRELLRLRHAFVPSGGTGEVRPAHRRPRT